MLSAFAANINEIIIIFNVHIIFYLNHNKLAALVGLASLLTSCSVKEDSKEDFISMVKSKVTVDLQTFDISQSELTKATSEKPPHRIVFKVFDTDSSVVYGTCQRSGAEGYGTLSFELAPGEYDFVAVAHDVANSADTTKFAAITSPSAASMPDSLVEETFCAVKHVTISPSTNFSSSMSLPRVNSCLRLIMKGKFPAEAKTIKIVANTAGTYTSNLPAFNPSTGLTSSNRQWIKIADASQSIGKTDVGVKLQMLLTAAEQDINVVATAYDSSGNVIISHTLTNVTMKQNRKTVASGDFFNGSGTGSFTFNTNWEEDSEISY